MYVYKTSGVCSTEIHVEMENDTIKSVEFVRGCPGNLFGISSLVKGMNIDVYTTGNDISTIKYDFSKIIPGVDEFSSTVNFTNCVNFILKVINL